MNMGVSTALKYMVTMAIIISLLSVPSVSTPPSESLQDTVVSSSGVVYNLTFFEGNFTLIVRGKNPTESIKYTGYVIEVDNRRRETTKINVSSDSGFQHKFDITESLHLLSTNHTIYFSTFGADTYLNFTKRIDYRNTTRFPKPHITDVRVANGTVEGEPSTVAYVTVANPTNQLYSMKLLVHTEKTQGGLYAASTPEYSNYTVKVELLEDRGSVVAGEVRLYVGDVNEKAGGLDQVEFVGRAGEGTAVYNRSYEPVRGPWAADAYAYENESVGDSNGVFPDSASSLAVRGLAALVVVGVLTMLVRRWR